MMRIFQSTHPQRVRLYRMPCFIKMIMDFNPRTLKGCDASILVQALSSLYFNPRTLKGCDPALANSKNIPIRFQSTHPQRVRLGVVVTTIPIFDFNPRTLKGCDVSSVGDNPFKGKFQSTHPQRVRRLVYRIKLLASEISIHAPSKGATANFNLQRDSQVISIHAPSKGATQLYL